MNPVDVYTNVISPMADSLGLFALRNEQNAPAPDGIYLSYKIRPVPERGGAIYPHYEDAVNPDPTKKSVRFYRTESVSVSVNLHGRQDDAPDTLQSLYEYADQAIDYLAVHGAQRNSEQGIAIDLSDTVKADRTSLKGPGYEHQIGFDFIIRSRKETVLEVDAVDMTATFSGVAGDYI